MKTTPPRTPTGSISCCPGLIKNVFSIAQTMNTECVFNMKCAHKTVGGKAPSSSCNVFYVYIQKYLPGLAISIYVCLGQCWIFQTVWGLCLLTDCIKQLLQCYSYTRSLGLSWAWKCCCWYLCFSQCFLFYPVLHHSNFVSLWNVNSVKNIDL